MTPEEYYQHGLCTFPVGEDKLPYKKASWKDRQTELLPPIKSDAPALAVVCGEGSGGLELIDIDSKYDISGKLWDSYKRQINFMLPGLLEKLVVQKTVGGGYHFLYRCSKIEGNQKLARRVATEEEQQAGEKQKVLIETRGQGGYALVEPSPGYEVIHGNMANIPTLSLVERETILNAARYFDEIEEKAKEPMHEATDEVSPFQDYNERGDALSLLLSHGWKEKHTHGENIHLQRPGKDGHGCSATYHRGNNWLYVFSTSTEFDAPEHYKPAAIFTQLECNGDWSQASKRLRQMGYGEQEKTIQVKAEDETFDFIEDSTSMDLWIENVRQGNLKMGLPTCFPSLNPFYLYKDNSFDVINGHDNVGKTLMLVFMAVDSAKVHGWKWIIWPAENKPAFIRQKVMELYIHKPISDMSGDEYRKARLFADEHFTFLKNSELYSHDEILTIGQRSFRKQRYNGFLIDPYNALRIDMSDYGKLSTHEYHYEITTKMRKFANEYCSLYLNCHAISEALRRTDAEGYPRAPHKADTEGGGKFSNRADNFLTIHRKTQHPDEWMVTEIHVRKIKEQETGGRPTPLEEPVKVRMTRNKCDFVEYVEGDFGENDIAVNPNEYIEPIKHEDVPF